MNKVDVALNTVNGWGRYNRLIYSLLCIPAVFTGIAGMIFVWTGYKMKFRCFVPGCDNTTTAAYLYNSSHTVFTIPTTTPGESQDQCQRYADSESLTNGHCTPERFSRNSTVPCAEYVYDPSIMLDSVMSQFNLVCDRGWLLTLVNTIYMVGMLVGSFCIGAFSDKFGRKKAMLLSFLMIGVSGAATPFAPNLATLIILRFFTGVGSVGNFMSLFVLALELVSTRVRTWCGLVIEIPFSTGISLIGVVAIFVNRWQQLQFIMLAPALIFLVYALFIPESPRWLMSAGRVAEGELVLELMAKYNRTEHPQESASTFSLDGCIDGVLRSGYERSQSQWERVCQLYSRQPHRSSVNSGDNSGHGRRWPSALLSHLVHSGWIGMYCCRNLC